ncbi:MAG: hypothetical protein KKG60_01455 [Nanoarchaeota archaeon]|nr:hypothetical protein [Nanoarchaeota archaeon]
MGKLEEEGFYKFMTPILFIIAIISFLVAISSLLFPLFPEKDPRRLQLFSIGVVFGVISLTTAFYVRGYKKKIENK